jgi:hypothetical protein
MHSHAVIMTLLIAVHYHLHTLTGEDLSTRAFNPKEPAIGRVDKLEIAPPTDVLALKRCIARVEQKPIYVYGNLYGDVDETEPWDDKTHLADVHAGTFPGSTAAAPLLIVQPERRPGLYNRPLNVLEAQSAARTAFWNVSLA